MPYVKKLSHLPPGCGDALNEPLLYNPYQQAFQAARRLRFCLNCRQVHQDTHASGSTGADGLFICDFCQKQHFSNLTAPRLNDHLLVLSGRGGGKTLIGAHAAREEIMVPRSIGWVMGATHKILHDSTFPTLVKLLPPDWIKKWDADNQEIHFKNDAMVAFRSLQDNPDRARGPHGVGWGWFDEAAECPERAFDVFEPTLIKAAGIVFATTTVHAGFDWTWDKIEKHAQNGTPGYYAVRYWTEENPLFKTNPTMRAKIERARLSMTPAAFAREYRSERVNAEQQIYDYSVVERQCLNSDEAVRKHIPEWPEIHADRPILIGLDSGVDHPFGAVMIVVTPTGLIQVDEYLQRMKAISLHKTAITTLFQTHRFGSITWSANKNEANLRLEFGVGGQPNVWRGLDNGITVVPAESKHEIGIQRVQAWLLTGSYFIVRAKCPRTVEQLQAYRFIDNKTTDGQKQDKERVFKKNDELPDAIRYALMAYPELPEPKTPVMNEREQKRWDAMDERTRLDIQRVREFDKDQDDRKNLREDEDNYPFGGFFGGIVEDVLR